MSEAISANAGKTVHQTVAMPITAVEGDIWIRGVVGQPGNDVFIMRGGAWSHRDDGDLPESVTDEMKAEAKRVRIALANEKMRQQIEERKARDTPQSSSEDAW